MDFSIPKSFLNTPQQRHSGRVHVRAGILITVNPCDQPYLSSARLEAERNAGVPGRLRSPHHRARGLPNPPLAISYSGDVSQRQTLGGLP
jgi:hypothetical protein